jgi:thiol-disulfide isomerase/thioredoxin
MDVALLIARLVLAAVFGVAAVTKLADRGGSRGALADFGVPERIAAPLGTILPLAELAVAALLLPASTCRWGAVGALALLVLFIIAIARSMARGEAPDCHCFGQLHSEPAGPRALVRNFVLAALAAFVAVGSWSEPGLSAVAWIGKLSPAGKVAIAAGAAIALLAALTAAGLLALLRQNGRLLLRLDELEQRLDAAGAPRTQTASSAPHQGLPLGAAAPSFTLSGLYGESVTLQSLTSADVSVLLLFTDPKCGPCNALLPSISDWQRVHAGRLTIAVLTRGSVEDNRAKVREHGVASVWMDDGLEVYNAYQGNGTPGAVLLDASGRIASGVAAGADAITALVAAATGSAGAPVMPVMQVPAQPWAAPAGGALSEPAPPPMPPVPSVGAPAPNLQLLDLAGEPLSLADSERDTLVMFWNPSCGFCARMLEDVRAFEQAPPAGAPRLLLISTGSVADNEAMGLTSPIALDQGFAAGLSFGATGTPSGILVNSRGEIASGLAVGAPGVMALARPPSAH